MVFWIGCFLSWILLSLLRIDVVRRKPYNPFILKVFFTLAVVGHKMNSGQKKMSWWKRLGNWWGSKPELEQQRLKSFIPLFLYAVAVIYGVIYLSILNTVNRGKGMDAVKTWYGGDRPEIVRALKAEKEGLASSFKNRIRKQVSGNR